MKIGIPRTYFYENLDATVESCLLDAMAVFKSLKIELVEVDVPNMQMINQNMGTVLAYEAFQLHQDWLNQFPLGYADQVRARIEFGKDLTSTVYEQAIQQRSILQETVQSHWFSHCDAILVPTLQIETPSIEATTKGSTAEILSNLMRVTQNTKGINYLSLPALSMPVGFTKGGLPIGVQLIGNQFAEERLLQIGNAFQEVTNWHQQMPQIAIV